MDSGTLTTKAFRFAGKDFFVNGVGPITVRFLDGGGKALGTSQLKGDSLQHKVLFDGKSLDKKVRDNIVRLQFTVGEGGHLYSFLAR